MIQFREFVDKKNRKAKKHLGIIKEILQKNNMKVDDFLENQDDPHIFLHSPDKNLSFDGIRIYEIADNISYRTQSQKNTHPFGKAYLIQLEEIFNELMAENMKEEEAGNEVIKELVEELNGFFKKSAEAEDDLRTDADGVGKILIGSNGTDYANLVFTKS
jgi:hypothetical protein